ncbi:MAG: SDR family NAD(P)-dependent oxidoreductase [Terriglobales bacterium]
MAERKGSARRKTVGATHAHGVLESTAQAKPLTGRVVLITGAARRIGRQVALAMARAGADVAITFRTSERDAHHTIEQIGIAGVRGLAIRCDVRDPLNVKEMVDDVGREFGRLDILVNNAAIYETVNFERITAEQWDNMFATNVRGPFLVSQAAAPQLRTTKGRIINIGSLGGLEAWATHAHYCASKAALVMLTEVTAKALAPEVAVNCVAPGMIWLGESKPTRFLKHIAQKTPMQRAGTAADVVEAVMFLASATHFITGQVLTVDGGLRL